MNTINLLSPDVLSTVQIGRIIGECLPRGTFVALDGILGAGKTQLVKGIACGLDEGGWAALRSPTFALMHSYHGGRCVLHHVDFYRLNEAPELPGEIVEAMDSEKDITVVEWADIWSEVWPDQHIHIHMEVGEDDDKRHVTVSDPHGLCPKLATELSHFEEPSKVAE
ncbi:MAG: tRNA (adenosine(37)-N6)-threonylcarbamoyltransferase complex ATPase subunit type 1 TsaE [Planctomycetota bacterium]|jgi:tRNA threonylcarbamoyladenosine biosynthesis protein TsaE